MYGRTQRGRRTTSATQRRSQRRSAPDHEVCGNEDCRTARPAGTASRARATGQSTHHGIINQIRAFLLERGVAIRQGLRFLRAELPRILATSPDVLSARMVWLIKNLAEHWHRLDERIDRLSDEIAALAQQDAGCERLMSVPGIGPIISSAMVAAIGTGDAFSKGRDFAAWLGFLIKPMSWDR